MSNLDIATNITVTYLERVTINSDGDHFTNSIDNNQYDGGYFLTAILTGTSGGTFTCTLQEKQEDQNFIDVPANKLIDPTGNGNIVLDGLNQPFSALGKLGSFSTRTFIRFKIVASGTAGSNQIEIVGTRNPESKPDFSPTI